MRPISGKPQEIFNPNYPEYSEFHSKFNASKRMHPAEYCDNSDSNLLKDLKELPPLHPSQIDTVLRKKDISSRNPSQKGEPIFPPPPDPSCSISARPPVTSASKSTSNMQRARKGSQSFNQAGPSSNKYTMPSTSCMNNFSQSMRPLGVSSSLVPDSYPYSDLRAKYDPGFYQTASSCYDQLVLPGFSNYEGFSTYAHSSGHGAWPSLGKYDQNMSGRLAQSSTSLSPPDNTASYRASYPVTTGPENPPGFATNLPFNQPFQQDNFMQSMQSYPPSIDPQQPSYGMSLPSAYAYPPPNTTSYM